ncbi:MAG: universal stress protein [Bryobacterales bacterium]|nr:universal stress protein [Bryobacterales bacterium]
MVPFRRILFPVDYSEACRMVAPHVRQLALHYSAELYLVHAVEVYGVDLTGVESETCKREASRIRQFGEEWFPDLKPQSLVTQGEPANVISSVVHRHGVDLLMMPSRGTGAVRRLLLGSVTAKILHDSSIAVWTAVPETLASRHPPLPYRSILCAVSDEDESAELMKAAAAVAKSFDVRLAIVHAVESPPVAWEVDFAPYRDQLIAAANKRLQRLMTEAGIEANLTVASGPTATRIRQEAEERYADLLIVGRGHAQGKLGQFWSRLYEIVRESPCPVLSV